MPAVLAADVAGSAELVCPACGSERLRNAFGRGKPAFIRCGSCASLFDPSPPPPNELRALYEGPGYFVKAGDQEGGTLYGYPGDYLADREMSEIKFERVLGHLERYVEPGRLLDVGAGPGFLLSVARRRGWSPVGVDLNSWAADYARDQIGLEVRVGEIGDAGFGDGEFDAITMLDLIEHLPDPNAPIAEAARLLRPDGALAILTPDAGSRVSRALGHRWPEVRRPGEHTVLFSIDGLARMLARHGFVASGWHPIGKTASLATLAADVAPVAPGPMRKLRRRLSGTALGGRVIEFDPRTKFCLYARRLPEGVRAPTHTPARVLKRPERLAGVEEAIVEELESLGHARRYCDWMFDQFADHVQGTVAEVGAGTGTFSRRILERGVDKLLMLEPEPRCFELLRERFKDDPRAQLAQEGLPGAPSLEPGAFDLVVSQNVLEHISDDRAAFGAMAAALREGGHLALIVPAGPRLFGPLDEAYGHRRRYSGPDLLALAAGAGLEVEALRPLNALGIPAWWSKNLRPGARVGAGSLLAYEAALPVWRRLEERLQPAHGLSLFLLGRRP